MNETNDISSLVVYTSESQINAPRVLLKAMWRDLRRSKELSWRLFIRDLAAQYRQSILGVLWAFLPPIVTSLIFIVLQSRNIMNFQETDVPYPVYVLIGTILWQIFNEGINAPLKSVVAAKPLLAKISFPQEALIVSSIYFVAFNTLIKGVIIIGIILFYRIHITVGMLLSPIAIIMLLMLGICIGLLLTPIGMLYSDIATAIPIFMQLLFFLTPVVYPPIQTFPLAIINFINPVTPLLVTARDLITIGSVPTLIPFMIISFLTFIFLFIAWVIYRVSLPIIIERMSA